MRHDIVIMIGTLIGWHLPCWFLRVHQWLDNEQHVRRCQQWDEDHS